MRRRVRSAFGLMVLVAVVAALSGSTPRAGTVGAPPDRGGDREPKHLINNERDKIHAAGPVQNAATEQVGNRAFPNTFVESSRALAALASFRATRSNVRSPWTQLGPVTPLVPAIVTYHTAPTTNSGRVTAMAIDPNCGIGRAGCRLWVGAAGGGVWRTSNALAAIPQWTPLDNGVASNAIGSLLVDPTDPTGSTIYAGTGEGNGSFDSEAGVGLYRSTDGGDHWTLVPGSPAVSSDRAIGSIAVDPTNRMHVYIGTGVARHSASGVYGGRFTPPNAPGLGVYESTNGGASFNLAFSRAPSPNPPSSGVDWFQGSVNQISLDQADPQTVYASLQGYGIWRRSARLDPGTAFHQVFATRNPADTTGDRTQFGLTRIPNQAGTGQVTRIYAGDSSDDERISELWRTDNADRAAAALTTGTMNLGWTGLSADANGTPPYTSYNYCQGQCGYDDPLAVDPHNPDVVWLGGQMAYNELPEGFEPNRSNGRTVIRSTNAGATFTDMTQDAQSPPTGMHPDQHFIVLAPGNSAIAFTGSDGGVLRTNGTYVNRSNDCGARPLAAVDMADCRMFLSAIPQKVDSLNNGLATLQFQGLSVNLATPYSDVMGGTQDNGTWAFFGGPVWTESIGGDGGQSVIDSVTGARQHTYTGTTGDVNFQGTNPATWAYDTEPMDTSPEASAFYTPLIGDPAVAGSEFMGAEHVWRTTDNGGQKARLEAHCKNNDSLASFPPGDHTMVCGDWQPLGPNLTDGSFGDRSGNYVVALGRAASDHGTLWVGMRRGRMFISQNADSTDPAAVTFTRIDTPATPGRFISGIAVDPADANHAWISYNGYNAYTPTTPGHVFEVRYNPATHTASFTDRSFDLGDQPIESLVYDPPTGDLYAATDFGVVHLPQGATAWEKLDNGLPPVAVFQLTIVPGSRLLFAATHGRGAWRLALPRAH